MHMHYFNSLVKFIVIFGSAPYPWKHVHDDCIFKAQNLDQKIVVVVNMLSRVRGWAEKGLYRVKNFILGGSDQK